MRILRSFMSGLPTPLCLVAAFQLLPIAAAGVSPSALIKAETGTNDQRISDMGPNGSLQYFASQAAIAFNPTANEFLVVWAADDDTAPLVDNEMEIFGQRIDAATGLELGVNDFRISDMGPDGDIDFGASTPSVAYNAIDDEYLVVWSGRDDTPPLAIAGEFEIFGQRLAADGTEVGANDFRISDMGPDGSTSFGAATPRVVFNSTDDEYFVVWRANDDAGTLSPSEREIYGQRIDGATGAEVGPNDIRLSDMGPDGNASFNAEDPDVAYSSFFNEYGVVWSGDDNTPPLVDNEPEIFFQRVGADGTQTGINDQRISVTGPPGNINFFAFTPAIAFSRDFAHEYLIVWSAVDGTVAAREGREIYGQRLSDSGAVIGVKFRISSMGPDLDTLYDALAPDIQFSTEDLEYLVVWHGDDDRGDLFAEEFEIFGQRLSEFGVGVGFDDERLSDLGPPSHPGFTATFPAIAYSQVSNLFGITFQGDDDLPPLVQDETEIFLQRFRGGPDPIFGDGFESGGTTAWSTTVP